jgi:hypothetical protein
VNSLNQKFTALNVFLHEMLMMQLVVIRTLNLPKEETEARTGKA